MRCLFVIVCVLYASSINGKPFPDPTDIQFSRQAASNLHVARSLLVFIENKGQVTDQYLNARPDINYIVCAAPGLNIFVGNGVLHYQFSNPGNIIKQTPISKFPIPASPQTCMMYRMDVELEGANKNAKLIAEEKQDYYENHFTGGQDNHCTSSLSYRKLTYQDIYPHIDWVLHICNEKLEQEFVIKEGGNISDIQLKYGGAGAIKINTDGRLTTATPLGIITELPPVAYQQDGKEVKSKFKISGNILTFEAGHYSGRLIIDPVLDWATYYGGSGDNYGQNTTTDNSGNVYITGWTNSTSGIATSGSYEATYRGGSYDAFLAKFTSAGAILWATYIGGSGDDVGYYIATDTPGNVYMAGWTNSTSGIATPGAYEDSYNGGPFDAFLAKFTGSGAIEWATYYGSDSDDEAKGVVTDRSGNVYIAGWTNSIAGIATPGAYQVTYGGGTYDAFLAKFNDTGVLQWSTYFGGSGEEVEFGLACDNLANVYITGYTPSTSGIATAGAHQAIEADAGAYCDAFLAKFNSAGAIQWGTYYGGTGSDYGQGVATDHSGNVYISGFTNSTTSIATPGAYHSTYLGGAYDAFLAKFNTGGYVQWATYFGGTDDDEGQGVATDDSANVYITGYTASDSGIATPGAYDTTFSGGTFDAFLARLNSSGVPLWSTYYGGSREDEGLSVTTFPPDVVYITGQTNSTSGIATPDAYQTIFAGGEDAFLAKFIFCTDPSAGTIVGTDSVCIDSAVTLTDSISGGVWSSIGTSAAITAGVVRGISTGTDTIKYSVFNACGNATAEKLIYVVGICVTGVGNLSLPAPEFNLYPNPAQNEVNISANNEINYVMISNILGQIVYTKTCNTTKVQINISNLNPGVYFVKINGSKMEKFVKL